MGGTAGGQLGDSLLQSPCRPGMGSTVSVGDDCATPCTLPMLPAALVRARERASGVRRASGGEGRAGQPCSVWAGAMDMLIATLGHELHEEEAGWELTPLATAELAAVTLGELERIELGPRD